MGLAGTITAAGVVGATVAAGAGATVIANKLDADGSAAKKVAIGGGIASVVGLLGTAGFVRAADRAASDDGVIGDAILAVLTLGATIGAAGFTAGSAAANWGPGLLDKLRS